MKSFTDVFKSRVLAKVSVIITHVECKRTNKQYKSSNGIWEPENSDAPSQFFMFNNSLCSLSLCRRHHHFKIFTWGSILRVSLLGRANTNSLTSVPLQRIFLMVYWLTKTPEFKFTELKSLVHKSHESNAMAAPEWIASTAVVADLVSCPPHT